MDIIFSSVAQGLLWAILAIGVFMTYRVLDIADLSAEGTFPLGAAVGVTLIVQGVPPVAATILAMVAGMLAGLIAGFLHTKMKIPALLTGILMLTGLYSVNLRVLSNRANLSLAGQSTLMRTLQAAGISRLASTAIVGTIAVGLVVVVLTWFFQTEVGLSLRATGNNEVMAEANSININLMKVLGYMLGNGLIALAGALIAQNNGYADVGMGTGTIVIGLASVIISEVLFRPKKIAWHLLVITIGSILYRLVIDLVLTLGVQPQDLKLFSAIVLALVLWLPEIKRLQGKEEDRSIK
ncbi:MAG: ABC transporter permease [Clostridiaceae bacterium]|nr:ABC transporter permease [Clostridiaceae bacterium]